MTALHAVDAADSIDLDRFRDEGYVVVRGGMCDRPAATALRESVLARLAEAGIDLSDATTFHSGQKWHIWDSSKANSNSEGAHARIAPIELPGFDRVRRHLDALHGGGGSWRYLDDARCGDTSWATDTVHVRYPRPETTTAWRPPFLGWHVDGAHFARHRHDSPEQSAIVLPVLSDVERGGGATCVVPRSHVAVRDRLIRSGDLSYAGLFALAHWIGLCAKLSGAVVETAPTRAGDVLIMHPLLVHSASANCTATPRLAFNMGVRWTLPRPRPSALFDP